MRCPSLPTITQISDSLFSPALSLGPLILEALIGSSSNYQFHRLFYFMLGSISLQVLLSLFMIYNDSQTGSVLRNYKRREAVNVDGDDLS